MISQGFTLMLAGMGTVFVFLTLLVLVMMAMSAFFQKYAHRFKDPEPAGRPKAPAAGGGDDAEIAVAIAAVHALNS
jgi:oxaloacetate decarboxylase gamma subunit